MSNSLSTRRLVQQTKSGNPVYSEASITSYLLLDLKQSKNCKNYITFDKQKKRENIKMFPAQRLFVIDS
jgi:hypothetical protein